MFGGGSKLRGLLRRSCTISNTAERGKPITATRIVRTRPTRSPRLPDRASPAGTRGGGVLPAAVARFVDAALYFRFGGWPIRRCTRWSVSAIRTGARCEREKRDHSRPATARELVQSTTVSLNATPQSGYTSPDGRARALPRSSQPCACRCRRTRRVRRPSPTSPRRRFPPSRTWRQVHDSDQGAGRVGRPRIPVRA